MHTIKKGIQCLSGFPPTQSWPDLLFSAPFRSGVQSTILRGESCVFLSSRTFINGYPFWFSRYSVHSFSPRLTSLQLPPCHNCKGHWIASRPTSKLSSGYPFFLVVSREKLCLGCVSLAVRMFHLITTRLSKKVLKKERIEERRTKEGTNKRTNLAKWSSLENQGLWPNLTTTYDRMYWSGYFNLPNRFRRYVYTFWENCGWTSSEVVQLAAWNVPPSKRDWLFTSLVPRS